MLLSLLSHQQQSSSSLSSLLSSPIASLAYADKIKMKNKSLINDISEQLVKNSNGNNSKDELQNILQQVQMQISLIAGQDKATNAIKQIESVIELNPNGHLAQSLLFLAKKQATGNIVDVNKVTTDVARYAAAGGDSIVGLLEQSSSSSSSSIMPPSPQQQEQQPLQSLPSSSTITSFGNTSSNIIDNSNSSLMSTLPQVTPQLTQSQGSSRPLSQTIEPSLSERPANNVVQQDQAQTAQSQPIEQQQQEQATSPLLPGPEIEQQQIRPQSDTNTSTSSTSSPVSSSIPPLVNSQNQSIAKPQSPPTTSLALPPSQTSLYPDNDNNENNNAHDYNNTNIANDADNRVPNSTPQSTIKITSVDRSPESIYSDLPLSMSNSTNQHYQSQGREQLQQRIQEIMNQFNSVNGNDGSSLPKYIERN
jgi:hypothetical protein